MTGVPTTGDMSTRLAKVAERAKEDPNVRFNSLAHLVDVAALRRAYERLRKNAAVGVDGVTVEKYGQNLEENLAALHERMKSKQYRHQPIKRVYIPKEDGTKRPLGISATEDKIVQGAVCEVLGAIYEPQFVEGSYGFRPKRSCHDAIRAIDRVATHGKVSCILELDVVSFFDSLDRTKLREMLQKRIADGSLMRLIGKCLHVGILDGEEFSEPERGTAQGSILSPILGNIYLHYALDLWFEQEIKPRLNGEAHLIRYADDAVLMFEHKEDGHWVLAELTKRMASYGLALHPDKTRLVSFGRPSTGEGGKGPGNFDFLGFTIYWCKRRDGQWRMACKTRRGRLSRIINDVHQWCRGHRHLPVKEQHAALTRRVQGHFNYFGVNGNGHSLYALLEVVKRSWFKWLNRRSQRASFDWKRFNDLLRRFPLPKPIIKVQIWG